MFYDIVKRIIDFTIAVVGIIVLSPVLIILSVIVRFDSPGPIIYKGVRTGLHGNPFRIFKFRTMVANAEQVGGTSTAKDDARITRSGRFLRKYKLDELPQLFNVLRGEMSFVGPRPEVEEYTRLYTPEEQIILTVRPGITDYASLEFINLGELLGNESPDEVYRLYVRPKKNALRVRYVKERSLYTDFVILLRTLLKLFRRLT